MRHFAGWGLLLLCALARPSAAQDGCPAAAGPDTDAGWTAYRAGEMEVARTAFQRALQRCPTGHGARVGLGYVSLRRGDLQGARSSFEAVVAAHPADVDALVGLGLTARRAGDLATAKDAFERVLRLDPGNQDAARFLAEVPAGVGAPPPRPPLVRPDTVVYPARVAGERFEVRSADGGWRPFYIKGINLGAALPGRHPSEFPDSAVYARWIAEMAAMGTNAVRVYTIHPPAFYQALLEWNRSHPASPLWLIHGVWAELPEDHDFAGAAWEGDFFREMERVVDLLHGRADIAPRPGHASGFYTADVSPWVLAYIIGREWEPFSVVEFNALRPSERSFAGRYLRVQDGTPMEAWAAKACEHLVAYEMTRFNAQRPVAYTNWPTLDPLRHPTETTVEEEMALVRTAGEPLGARPLEYDNDATGLDAMLTRATAAFPAGWFASYHAYPYYPDFMVLDPEYNRAASPEGRSNYFGYLRELAVHHRGMPVVISEYGVPASIGSAHLQPQGWHHGGHTEESMARINARLTREIAQAGLAGGAYFAWIDEWFKKNWIVIDFEIPLERTRMWHNRMDAEQHYGVFAMDAGALWPTAPMADRASRWDSLPRLYGAAAGARLQAAADEAYLWLRLDNGGRPLPAEVLIGLDMIRPEAGDFRWPGGAGSSPVGLEFVLRVAGDEARLLADPPSNPILVEPLQRSAAPAAPAPEMDAPLAGFFAGRLRARYNRPFVTRRNEDGVYDSLRVVTNRRRFGRDGLEHAAMGYDRGILRQGPLPDGQWERNAAGTALEVRIPWLLLNVTDPSGRRVLQDPSVGPHPGDFGTEVVPGIRITAALRSGREWLRWPASGRAADVASFTWDTWESPRYHERRRPLFDALRAAFSRVDAPASGGQP